MTTDTTPKLTSPEHPVPDQFSGNLYASDAALQQLLRLYLPADVLQHLEPTFQRLGGLAGSQLSELAQTSDHNPPTLEHRTRDGRDVQRIIKHPAYIEMERLAFSEFSLAAISHRKDVLGWQGQLSATVKYALTYLFVQAEFGLCCPVSMTDSLTRTLKKFGSQELIDRYLPLLTHPDFDNQMQGAMFMTEQGAGSDIAATTTLAKPHPTRPGEWLLFGDKWFCSNPDASLAMVLARVEGMEAGMKGISLFLLPRDLPDGSRNNYRIVRLKDKLGSRSMASGEITLNGATAWMVGEPGRGFVQMADMVNNSRLSNGVRAAGMMRRAVAEALHIARGRQAFGKRLIDMPLMQKQLLKLIVPTEQARSMVFQTARALERADAIGTTTSEAYRLVRILTPLLKFRACRDARKVTGDAMEVRGGCGYIEDFQDARLLRDAHLGSIWEGTSNIVALDVIRAMKRDDAQPVLIAHLQRLLSESIAKSAVDASLAESISKIMERVNQLCVAVRDSTDTKSDAEARRCASALYHLTSCVAMVWEGRVALAKLVLEHMLLPRDPLAIEFDAAHIDGTLLM
jgi:acyl-CoA dehydrogenase